MERIEIRIFIPALQFSRFEKDYYDSSIIEAFFNELPEEINKIPVSSEEDFITETKILDSIPSDFEIHRNLIFTLKPDKIISITIKGEIDCESDLNYLKSYNSSNEISETELIRVVLEASSRIILEKYLLELNKLLILSHISSPGILHVRKGESFLNHQPFITIDPYNGYIREAYVNSLKKKYPKIEFLSLKTLIEKLKENSIDFKPKPSNSLEKALNCFTHLAKPYNDINEILIYSIIGLETIYVRGESNIQSQLNEKCQLFLGELLEHKKLIKTLYNNRSKLFHGEYYLQPHQNIQSGNDYDFNEIEDSLFESFAYSTMILIATIQKMIMTNRTELEFKYSLKN